MIYHTWCARAMCGCGYLWTTPGSSCVVCKCGHCSIHENVPSNTTQPVTDEDAFKAAVAADLGVDVADLTITQA